MATKEAEFVKAMKEAKTAPEMVISWGAQTPGRDMEETIRVFGLYVNRKPEMIEDFPHKPYWKAVERGILDRKTRELVMLGMLLAMERMNGVIVHCQNAKAAGVTEEEILEVAYLSAYVHAKANMGSTCAALTAGFKASASVTRSDT